MALYQPDIDRKRNYCAAILLVEFGTKWLRELLLACYRRSGRNWNNATSGQQLLLFEFSQPNNVFSFKGNFGDPGMNGIPFQNNLYRSTTHGDYHGVQFNRTMRLDLFNWQHLHDGDIENWDITLLTAVLEHSKTFASQPCALSHQELKAVQDLRTIRNTYYGHLSELKMDAVTFQTLKAKLQPILNIDITVFFATKEIEDMDKLWSLDLGDVEVEAMMERGRILQQWLRNPALRLREWMEAHTPLPAHAAVDTTTLRSYHSNPNIVMAIRNQASTITRSNNQYTTFGGSLSRPNVAGHVQLLVMPEGGVTKQAPTSISLIFGSRMLKTANLTETDIAQLSTEQQWFIGLECDQGLAAEECKIEYDSLVPGWMLYQLPSAANRIKVTSLNGTTIRLNGYNDEDCISTCVKLAVGDKIFLGDANYHHISVSELLLDSRDERDHTLLSEDAIRDHEVVGTKIVTDKSQCPAIRPSFQGGLSVVYKIRSKRDNRLFALKTASCRKYTKQLDREMQILASLGGHRNIIFPLDMIRVNRNKYAVKMEWANFGTLEHCMREENSGCKLFHDSCILDATQPWLIRWLRLVDIWIQMADACSYAHRKGVVHADLKPKNILVMGYRDSPFPKEVFVNIKLCDFNVSHGRTIWNEIISSNGGTESYRSPEQTVVNMDVTEKTDIWSMGIIVLELLTMNHAEKFQYPAELPQWLQLHATAFSWMESPPYCATLLHLLRGGNTYMLHNEPGSRPAASEIASSLRKILENIQAPHILPEVSEQELNRYNAQSRSSNKRYLSSATNTRLQEEYYLSIFAPVSTVATPKVTFKEKLFARIDHLMLLGMQLPFSVSAFRKYAQAFFDVGKNYPSFNNLDRKERPVLIQNCLNFFNEPGLPSRLDNYVDKHAQARVNPVYPQRGGRRGNQQQEQIPFPPLPTFEEAKQIPFSKLIDHYSWLEAGLATPWLMSTINSDGLQSKSLVLRVPDMDNKDKCFLVRGPYLHKMSISSARERVVFKNRLLSSIGYATKMALSGCNVNISICGPQYLHPSGYHPNYTVYLCPLPAESRQAFLQPTTSASTTWELDLIKEHTYRSLLEEGKALDVSTIQQELDKFTQLLLELLRCPQYFSDPKLLQDDCLLIALEYAMPFEIILQLLEIRPQSIAVKHNKVGSSPLHVLCQNPVYTEDQLRTLLQTMQRTWLQWSPSNSLVSLVDRNNHTALHYMSMKPAFFTSTLLWQLIGDDPSWFLSTPNNNVETSRNVLLPWQKFLHYVNTVPPFSNTVVSPEHTTPEFYNNLLLKLLNGGNIRTIHKNRADAFGDSCIHCAVFNRWIPLSLLETVIDSFPEALDMYGLYIDIPVNRVVAGYSQASTLPILDMVLQRYARQFGKFDANWSMTQLLQENAPTYCGLAKQDKAGNLPLHNAIEYFASFEVIEQLIAYFPQAVLCLNFADELPLDLVIKQLKMYELEDYDHESLNEGEDILERAIDRGDHTDPIYWKETERDEVKYEIFRLMQKLKEVMQVQSDLFAASNSV